MTEEFKQACIAIDKAGHGAMRIKSGDIVEGTFFDYESEWDDPNGDGFISLKGPDGTVRDVSASEFDHLIENEA